MPLRLRYQLAATCFLIFGCAAPAPAGYITELFRADASAGLADAVELTGVSGLGAVDVVVIDAGLDPGRHGGVLGVFTLPAATDVLLVTDQPVGPMPWEPPGPVAGNRVMVDQPLGLGGARSVLLFDRPTNLTAGFVNLFTDALQQARIQSVGAVLLDWVTLGPSAAAATLDTADLGVISTARPFHTQHDQPLENQPGLTAVRQFHDFQPTGRWLAGLPNLATGKLDHLDPAAALTPGLINPTWPPHTPEPAAAALWLALLSMSARRSCSAKQRFAAQHEPTPDWGSRRKLF